MLNRQIFLLQIGLFALALLSFDSSYSQMITGVWVGKVNKQKVEIKLVQTGDSLKGTAYYFESATRYRRYSIKGYLDESDNSVVWWDDQLLEDKMKGLGLFSKNKKGSSRADFNCPGGGVMKLDGNVYDNEDEPDGDIHLTKVETVSFKDEWDFVIENYIVGANEPDIIDSVSQITQKPTNKKKSETITEDKTVFDPPIKKDAPVENDPVKKEIATVPVDIQENKTSIEERKISPPTIEQKFESRENIFQKEIPVTGDSIELDFYDNAEIDGDSISLFLNGKLIFEHIALAEKAYVVKLAVSELKDTNELIMVAENLGSIPPNTSYMVAIVGDKRYDAQLASTENSSAMIRLEKVASHEP